MIRAAREKGRLTVALVQLRDFTDDAHRTTDDYPFGGGVGMIMKIEPIDRALQSVGAGEKDARPAGTRVILFSHQGRRFTLEVAIEYSGLEHLVLLCGRYKGIDERVIPLLGAEEISIGDYVLSGGEPAAITILDAVARLIPGVLGDAESAEADSFSEPLLDAPVYTRPEDVEGHRVPDVLMSGDHERVRVWRRREAIRRTWIKRPDLLLGRELSPEDRRLLDEIKKEEGR